MAGADRAGDDQLSLLHAVQLYQSRKVDTKNNSFQISFSKVDTGHIFTEYVFSKVDTTGIFQLFSFSEVDTVSECALLHNKRSSAINYRLTYRAMTMQTYYEKPTTL
jgi:hypothetical protein